MKRVIVDGLEWACRHTDPLNRIPGWDRVYQCHLARLSSWLDHRWRTGRWQRHDNDDEYDEWMDGLTQDTIENGHWHAW
ncbi:MAG: hypothetical protein JO079_10530 [Frankiaceae bacterium]|nr:hypothetical protein [Frankiaceae bacterium]